MNDAPRFDLLNSDARKVLSLAQEEAQRFNHNYIGTEHLLLGLIRLEEGVSATVLQNLGVELNKARGAVEFIIGRGDQIVLGEISLTPRSKKVIMLALDEARRMKQQMVGPEHILLGLVSEGEGIAAGVLESLGINLRKVRQETYRVLGLEDDQPEEPAAEIVQPEGVSVPLSFSPLRAGSLFAPNPLMIPQFGLLPFYRPWHIDTEQPRKTPVGRGTANKRGVGPGVVEITPGATSGTLLGWVVVNTGGDFTLTLYDGLADDAPALAAMHQPPTGACFAFHCVVERGLTYTLEGTPGSVTILYQEPDE